MNAGKITLIILAFVSGSCFGSRVYSHGVYWLVCGLVDAFIVAASIYEEDSTSGIIAGVFTGIIAGIIAMYVLMLIVFIITNLESIFFVLGIVIIFVIYCIFN